MSRSAFARVTLRRAAPVLLALALPAVVRADAVPAAAATGAPARAELAALPDAVREAVEAGKVVLLETVADGTVLRTKVVAMLPAEPTEVIQEIREYETLPGAFPEVRDLTFDRGHLSDRLRFDFQPHPSARPVSLAQEVTWSVDHAGDGRVEMNLVETSTERLQAERWEWQLYDLGDRRTLAFYETEDSFRSLPFKQRVLGKLADFSERLVAHVLVACVDRSDAAGQASPVGQ